MVRVHQLHIPAYLLTTKYLPAQLARDLAKARLFQGNFMFSDRVNGRTIVVALTIAMTVQTGFSRIGAKTC